MDSTYTLTCSMGHAPKTMTVMAGNDDEAMTKMMAELKQHGDEMHSDGDMKKMTDEETMEFIKTNWKKS